MWSDFGGQREAIDLDSEATAGREFAEETLGLFSGCAVDSNSVAVSAAQMAGQLRERQHSLQVIHQLRKGEYHMFVSQTSYLDPLMFRLATIQNAQTNAVEGAEKTGFAWVALADLLRAVALCGKRYQLHSHVHATGTGKQLVMKGYCRLRLHPCFASSLRLAQAAGMELLISKARLPVDADSPVIENRSNSDDQEAPNELPGCVASRLRKRAAGDQGLPSTHKRQQ
ncbi:hypothetical protein WJX72_005278 [[Myrmecia] bisecta]|uniref:Nudix hydrolase domain-containing protein n=1 Tax=[Myrmecia] bisecta TaxID=41462 RepID=A0AAW1QF42_9CHLO